jgi:hypothetical protein
MDLAAANLLASLLSYAMAITIGVSYVAPVVRHRPLADALTVLLWFHAPRYIALQIFSAADIGGLDAATTAQRTIAFGDVVTSALAILAIWALRRPFRTGRTLAWLAAIVGTADLVNATVVGIDNDITATASGWTWFVLALYVPILWVTAVMLLWQLTSRRGEPLAEQPPTTPPARAQQHRM